MTIWPIIFIEPYCFINVFLNSFQSRHFFFFFFLPSVTPRKHVIVFIFVLTQVEGKYNVKYLDEIELHSEFKDELHSRRPMYENT